MKLLLHAVFNERLPPLLYTEIKGLGWDGMRIDAQECDAEATRRLVEPAIAAGLHALVIVRDAAQIFAVPLGAEIEIRNEPDIGTNQQLPPARYVEIASECVDVAQALGRDRPIWIGAVSNLNRRGLDYLSAVFSARAWPAIVGCSVHRYPAGGFNESPYRAHNGFRWREDEVDALRQIIGARPWGVSELGYHTAARCRGWGWWRRCRRWSDAEVMQHLMFERDFFKAQGGQFLTVYQINDGPSETRLDRYGRRTADGAWKQPMFP